MNLKYVKVNGEVSRVLTLDNGEKLVEIFDSGWIVGGKK